jgi:hypothetical protein
MSSRRVQDKINVRQRIPLPYAGISLAQGFHGVHRNIGVISPKSEGNIGVASPESESNINRI